MLNAVPMRARMHGLGLGLLLVVATTVPALAQPASSSTAPAKTEYPSCAGKTISQADSDSAHRKYLAGKDDYDEGKYDPAIAGFKAAYEKDCNKHELLVIISRAYELNHNLPEAIRALEVYLERNPSSAEAQTHKNKIKTLNERLAEEKKKAAAPPAPTGAAPNGGTPAPENQGHTIYPWLVVGAGVVALSIGIVLLATTPALPEECNADAGTCDRLKDNAGQFTETDQQYKDRQAQAGRHVGQQLGGTITTIGGAVLIVGGLVWHFVEPTGPKDSAKPRFSPQLGPGYGGFALTGRF